MIQVKSTTLCPGVDKLTIGRLLATRLGARLLDNHSIYNVAFALTAFKSDAFYDTVRDVRAIASRQVAALPADVPVILTNAHTQDSAWGNDCWDHAVDLAQRTGRAHLMVLLECTRAENARRIQSPDRDDKRKPRDPRMFRQDDRDRPLIDRDTDRLLRLDVTDLRADKAAKTIADWLGHHNTP